MIDPKILKGFRDTLPELMIQKKEIIGKFENIFESYGFVPIDTPALEYAGRSARCTPLPASPPPS